MEQEPTGPVAGLLQSAYHWLREHDDGVTLTYRVALIAVSAVLAYLGVDVPDLLDEEG